MIYADLIMEPVRSVIQGGDPKMSIGVVFFGEKDAEKYWRNHFDDTFSGMIKVEDVLRFFAINNWKRAGSNNFYFDGKK